MVGLAVPARGGADTAAVWCGRPSIPSSDLFTTSRNSRTGRCRRAVPFSSILCWRRSTNDEHGDVLADPELVDHGVEHRS
jgi:hypothetical protein